jgi:hypothetical protein
MEFKSQPSNLSVWKEKLPCSRKSFKISTSSGGVVVFGILTLIGILALDTSWWESALFSAVLAVVGMVSLWWKEEVW